MKILGTIAVNARDVKHFGPLVLRRFADRNNRQTIKTRFGHFTIRRSDSDMGTLRQVYIGRDYDLDRFPHGKSIRNYYNDIISRGNEPLIIDAGANVGFASRFLASAYPQAWILAVEPDPDSAAICRHNTAQLSRVQVVEAALGAEPGRVALDHVALDGGIRQSNAVRTHRSENGVPVITVNDLKAKVPKSELMIVKIDIEGFEADLFSSATDWVSQTHVLIIEPHDWMLPGAGSSRGLQQVMLCQDREMLISGDSLVWIKRCSSGDKGASPSH